MSNKFDVSKYGVRDFFGTRHELRESLADHSTSVQSVKDIIGIKKSVKEGF